ncbi:ImmA/IrrE family metallo-endopeptidase [Heyndrickxia oleronia]|nr:ImmA/IrrE family metallo-endopeptidase [Heyndrickxia oleronia]
MFVGWIHDKVKELKEKCKTNDPFEIATLQNIQVVPWNLHEEINGFYKYDRRNKYIFVNNNLSEEMQRFVCAHELGHAILHPRANTPFLRTNTFFSVDRIEVEANTFAVHLLVRGEDFQNYETKQQLLKANGIPEIMEKFV